jgi:outer membrane receptor for ferrienterochelin and colicins
VAYLSSLRPTEAQVGLNFLNVANGSTGPLSSLTLDELPPIRESISNTLEAGYKGILANRILFAADVWWSRREGLVTPLTIQTPLVLLTGPQLGAYLVPRFMADLGMSQAQAAALAAQLVGSTTAPGLATIPVGVISSPDVNANGGQLLVTYVNVDETLELWGWDVSARVLIRREWSLNGSASWVSRDNWQTQSAGLVTLNAPTRKATLALNYDDSEDTGLSSELRVRYTNGFPVNSGVYVGTLCLNLPNPSPLAEKCVDDFTLLDLNLGYRLPFGRRNTTLQMSITNLLNEGYRPFPGVPNIGRMLLARVKYDF